MTDLIGLVIKQEGDGWIVVFERLEAGNAGMKAGISKKAEARASAKRLNTQWAV